MATRSYHITLSDDKESFVMQYVHYDGYPSWRLPILLKHFNTPEKVKELFSHGPMSAIDVDGKVNDSYKQDNLIVPITSPDTNFKKVIKDMIRDGAMPREEYFYFWDGDRWWLINDLYYDMSKIEKEIK